MADMTANSLDMKEPLGVGSILGETFSIFFKRIVQIFFLGFVVTFATLMLSGALVGFELVAPTGLTPDPAAVQNVSAAGYFIMSLLSFASYGILIGAFVLLAYDAKLGRSARTGVYVMAALRNIVPIAVLTIAFTIIMTIGFVLLIIPGLWVYAVLSVFIPAIVIEGAGFGAFGRSAALTKGYRWPIVGLLIILGIMMAVVSMVLVLALALPLAGIGVMGSVIAQSLASGLSYGLGAIPVALIYARLREIKEGVTVDSLADIFS